MRKLNRTLLILGALLLLPIFAFPEQTYVLKAGRLIDGQSPQIRRDVIVVIQGNKITAITPFPAPQTVRDTPGRRTGSRAG